MSSEYNYLCKYIVIGDGAVGKSNLLLRYAHGQFNPEYQVTIGVEFGIKDVDIGGKTFRIQIWDTAGQEMFRSITRGYYKNSVCACVVYDITNEISFENIKSWIEDCKKHSSKTILLVLIGNKIDLQNERKISYEEGEIFAKKNGMLFFETSAKNAINISNIFENSCKEISKKMDNGFYDLNRDTCGIKEGANYKESIVLDSNESESQENKRKCCR
jgi:small GTP-binding protein